MDLQTVHFVLIHDNAEWDEYIKKWISVQINCSFSNDVITLSSFKIKLFTFAFAFAFAFTFFLFFAVSLADQSEDPPPIESVPGASEPATASNPCELCKPFGNVHFQCKFFCNATTASPNTNE